VFIVQGLNDGLFSANQAIEAYQALAKNKKARPRLYLGGIGHPPSDGSLDSREATYVGNQVLAWFDHHLKGIENGIDEAAPIEFSRADYFRNRWDGTTRSAKRYPFGEATRLHLCTTGPSGGTLSGTACPGALPAAAVNQYAGPGYDSEPVTAQYAQQLRAGVEALTAGRVDSDRLPGVLTYEGPALADPLDLAGVPELSLRVASASVLPVVPDASAAAFQLDPKLWAVGPDGKAKLLTRGAFSEPLGGTPSVPSHKVDFEINGVSTVAPAGHRLRLTLQTADAPYLRPTPNPFAAVLFPGSAVELPTVAPKVEEARRSRTSRASRASRRRR
jgi:hypothetical protein